MTGDQSSTHPASCSQRRASRSSPGAPLRAYSAGVPGNGSAPPRCVVQTPVALRISSAPPPAGPRSASGTGPRPSSPAPAGSSATRSPTSAALPHRTSADTWRTATLSYECKNMSRPTSLAPCSQVGLGHGKENVFLLNICLVA